MLKTPSWFIIDETNELLAFTEIIIKPPGTSIADLFSTKVSTLLSVVVMLCKVPPLIKFRVTSFPDPKTAVFSATIKPEFLTSGDSRAT